MNAPGRAAGAMAGGLARLLLRLYPRSFRVDVGPEIADDLKRSTARRAADRGLAAAIFWALSNAFALVRGVLPEWRAHAVPWSGASRDLRDWIREFRQAGRGLARDRAFSVTIVVALTLGIAMATAVFSVVDGVLLRPLPYADADDVVMIWQTSPAEGIERDDVAVGNFLEWRERSTAFESMAALEPWGLEFLTESGPEEVEAWRVTEEFFEVLRTPPMIGRTLGPEDYAGGAAAVVVSHEFWQRRLGGDPEAVGRTIALDDAPIEVVGVMPSTFEVPPRNHLWVPRVFSEGERQNRVANYYRVVARVGPDATLRAAQADLDRVTSLVAAEYPDTNVGVGAHAIRLPDMVLGPVRSGLYILLACSAVLLVIACMNVASLVIARSGDRVGQMGMRAAMGAGRRDLVLPQVLECVILALVAGVASALLVTWTLGALKGLAPESLPRMDGVGVDIRMWAFALGTAFLVSLAVGLPATARASRVDLAALLSGSGRRATAGRRTATRREILVAVQLALALILVTAATLTARSVLAISALDPGYRTDDVAVLTTQVWRQYPTGDAQTAFAREAVDRLRAVPGMEAAGVSSAVPLAEREYADQATYFLDRDGVPVDGRESSAGAATVSPGYFDVLGIRLLEGRMFGPGDDIDAPPVVLINEELARRNWQGESPLGERMTVSFAGPPISAEIVGVVSNVRHGALDRDPGPRLYIHHPQKPNGALIFTARTSIDPAAVVESMKQALWELNGSVAASNAYAFRELRADAERERKFYATLLMAFAAAALVIAAVGAYGLGSYTVARRRSEIGIRLALGATPRRIGRQFLLRSARSVLVGLGLGLLGAIVLTRFVRGLLYGLSPTDPLTLGGSLIGLGLVGLLATYVPARRASRSDPTEALRTD